MPMPGNSCPWHTTSSSSIAADTGVRAAQARPVPGAAAISRGNSRTAAAARNRPSSTAPSLPAGRRASCRDTRSLSPLICASTLILASFSAATIFLAIFCSMPCLIVTFCRAPARLTSGSATSRQRMSTPRASRRARRMSSICLSWKSLGARWVTTNSSSSNEASWPLKSKRLPSSRLAVSTRIGQLVLVDFGNDVEGRHGGGDKRRFGRSF